MGKFVIELVKRETHEEEKKALFFPGARTRPRDFSLPSKKPGIFYAGCNINQFAPGKEIQEAWILNSTQWIPDSRYWFSVPIICGILDSLRYIPDFKSQDFGHHKQNFPAAKPKQYF